MLYVLSVVVAILLVGGQSLWKVGITRHHFALTPKYLLSREFLEFIFSPPVVVGMIIYAIATLLYMALMQKYPYGVVQALVVSATLIFVGVISAAVFHEAYTPLKVAGVILVIAGVVLISRY